MTRRKICEFFSFLVRIPSLLELRGERRKIQWKKIVLATEHHLCVSSNKSKEVKNSTLNSVQVQEHWCCSKSERKTKLFIEALIITKIDK